MQMMDIECKVVHTTDRIHSWDEVKLDGEWYHTDIYSDAGSPNYSHFNMNVKNVVTIMNGIQISSRQQQEQNITTQ